MSARWRDADPVMVHDGPGGTFVGNYDGRVTDGFDYVLCGHSHTADWQARGCAELEAERRNEVAR